MIEHNYHSLSSNVPIKIMHKNDACLTFIPEKKILFQGEASPGASEWKLTSKPKPLDSIIPMVSHIYTVCSDWEHALLEKCWRISLHVTDDIIVKLYVMQIERNGQKLVP